MVKRNICNGYFRNLSGDNVDLNVDQRSEGLKVTLRNTSFYKHLLIDLRLFILLLSIICFFNNIKQIILYTAILLALTLYKCVGYVVEENVIMVRSLGYQVTTKYLIGQKSTFIPIPKVQKIFINEVIFRNNIINLLMISLIHHDIQQLFPMFLHLKPSLECLEIIYRYLKDDVN